MAPDEQHTQAKPQSTAADAIPPTATSTANSTTASTSTSTPSPAEAHAASMNLPHRDRPPIDKILLEQYVTRDMLHTAALVDQQARQRDLSISQSHQWVEFYKSIRNEYRQWFPPSRLYGEGYNGYGNGHTDVKPGILYPMQKPRLGRKRTPLLRIKRKDMAQQADQVEELIPIRLDVDWDKIKLRDTFTWNLHERVISTRLFAEQLVEDLGLMPPVAEPVIEQIRHQVHEQLGDFFPPVYTEEEPLDPELPYSAYKNDEMRILVKLNITIGQHTLVDQFEWEINNPLNSPEEFAQSMSRDLALSGEFTTAIAHCIREQSQLFVRSLYIVGHPFDGRPVEDADLVAAFLPSPIPSVFRPQQQAKDYGPYLYELNEAELERNELTFSREQRRQKRSVNRRGGPTLPDLKDRQRTVRTLIVSSVLPGAAQNIEESRIYKYTPAAGGRKRPGAGKGDGLGDLSESEESDGSAPDSPALSTLVSGTARQRAMRGAATTATTRMSNLGRSETPESSATLHHHETRISARRFPREESQETPTLIIKLKISKDRFKQFLRDRRNPIRPGGRQATPSQPPSARAQSAVSESSTPAAGSMPPPSTPGASAIRKAAGGGDTPAAAPALKGAQIGRMDAPAPVAGQPQPTAPPPSWLTQGLAALQAKYPNDRFEGIMRYSPVNIETEMPVAAPPAGAPTPANIKYMFLPRIRCLDCPGKLYTPGPEMTVDNFEVHLRNRLHKEKVEARLKAAS